MTSTHELALMRLAAQRIVAPEHASAADAVTWMTAMQAQDLPGVVTSVALRTRGSRRADAEAALDSGAVVRTWPMRGTLHLIAAADIGWMPPLGAARVATTRALRQQQLGLDPATVGRAGDLAVEELSGGRGLIREELMAVWERAGIDTKQQRGYHLLAHFAQTGLVCLGPLREGRQAVVLIAEWVPHPRVLDREEALAEWALRYFRSHGPATVDDFAWWTGLRRTDARAGAGAVRHRLEKLAVEGTEYLMDPATPERLDTYAAEARGLFLLPGFDELVLGYRERGATVPAEFAQRLVPGGNGVFKPSVVVDGRVVGTWKRPARTGEPPAVLPFTSFTPAVDAAVRRCHAAFPGP